MILLWFIIILMAGGIVAWIVAQWDEKLSRWVALLATVINFTLAVIFWIQSDTQGITDDPWLSKFAVSWIPTFGVSFSLALDGLSLLMVLLTFFLGILSVLISWNEIRYRVGFYYFNLLWVLAGITGVFLTMDLFLFYFFWAYGGMKTKHTLPISSSFSPRPAGCLCCFPSWVYTSSTATAQGYLLLIISNCWVRPFRLKPHDY